jgi:excisionase family DNA binding protein
VDPLLLTLDEVAEALRQSRQSVYRHIERGELEAVKVGKSRRVTVASLEAFVERLRAVSTNGAA